MNLLILILKPINYILYLLIFLFSLCFSKLDAFFVVVVVVCLRKENKSEEKPTPNQSVTILLLYYPLP